MRLNDMALGARPFKRSYETESIAFCRYAILPPRARAPGKIAPSRAGAKNFRRKIPAHGFAALQHTAALAPPAARS
jgi:hypothetical protein